MAVDVAACERGSISMTDLESRPGDVAPDDHVVLTIIISSFDGRAVLSDCLRSMERNPPTVAYEIILVDDGSSDGTGEMVRKLFPAVHILRNERNRHYAYSNNRALDQARGDYVLLLNSDTIVLPNALDEMVAFLQVNPQVGAIGCKLLNEDGSIQWSVKSLPNPAAALFGARSFIARLWPGNPMSRKHLLHLSNDMTRPFAVHNGYVSSAASMMPRKVMQAVGHLDLGLAYHVDADYCKRITNAGYETFYLPTATIIHLNHRGGTTATPLIRLRHSMMFELHSYRFYCKHLRRSAWSPVQILVILGLFCHFMTLAAGQAVDELRRLARNGEQQKTSTG